MHALFDKSFIVKQNFNKSNFYCPINKNFVFIYIDHYNLKFTGVKMIFLNGPNYCSRSNIILRKFKFAPIRRFLKLHSQRADAIQVQVRKKL